MRTTGTQVWVRGRTNQAEYRVGRTYTIRKDTFGSYCADLLAGNARARASYLAVASMQQVMCLVVQVSLFIAEGLLMIVLLYLPG